MSESHISIVPVESIPMSKFGSRRREYQEAINECIRLNIRYAKVVVNGRPIKVGSVATAVREQVRELGLTNKVIVRQRDANIDPEENGVYIENTTAV